MISFVLLLSSKKFDLFNVTTKVVSLALDDM